MSRTHQTLRALTLGSVLAAGLSVVQAGAPSFADSTVTVPAGTSTIVIDGEGAGHGHGLSQYGANAAAERGLSTDQILRHYYPGTSHGTAGGQVRVLLSTRPSLVVATRSGLRASLVGTSRTWRLTHLHKRAARTAKRWRITGLSATRSRLSYLKGGRWRTYVDVSGQLQLTAGGAPIRLYAGADSGRFRGILRSARTSTTADRDIVNAVPLEGYLKGVVPAEMPARWAAAAVRAQATAARTYAVHERVTTRRGWFDVYDDTRSQVYRGYGAEEPAGNRAVDATRRRILTYGGRPAFTQFTASNGGYTLGNADVPYLVSARDVYDPVIRWTTSVSAAALKSRYMPAYPLGSLTLRTYAHAGGWVQSVVITSADGTHTNTVRGVDFRAWAGLKSGSFRFRR